MSNKIEIIADDESELVKLLAQLTVSKNSRIRVTRNSQVVYDTFKVIEQSNVHKMNLDRELQYERARAAQERRDHALALQLSQQIADNERDKAKQERMRADQEYSERVKLEHHRPYIYIEPVELVRGGSHKTSTCDAETNLGTPCNNAPDGNNKRCWRHYGQRAIK
jgi:hypothetical protein